MKLKLYDLAKTVNSPKTEFYIYFEDSKDKNSHVNFKDYDEMCTSEEEFLEYAQRNNSFEVVSVDVGKEALYIVVRDNRKSFVELCDVLDLMNSDMMPSFALIVSDRKEEKIIQLLIDNDDEFDYLYNQTQLKNIPFSTISQSEKDGMILLYTVPSNPTYRFFEEKFDVVFLKGGD